MSLRELAGVSAVTAGPLAVTAAIAAAFGLLGEQVMETVVMGAICAVGIAAVAFVIWQAREELR
ncbi:hypothetical protein [uncultured Parolsenella sp.]|uniref:hypothetical protein n=1 Tax=uncultured Parolsenella sp. TaxID=2083008 RepID=UPI0025DE8C07|nr:hypothetical protein [uncultured Parolsenella sp.]